MFIRQEKFGGTVPKVADNLIAPNMAKTAQNCRLTSGNLRALRDNLAVWTPTKAGTIKTILRYSGAYWFHWITDVHLIKCPLAADTQGRVYWTGEGTPKISDATIATAGGGTDYPSNSYDMAIPSPESAPTSTPVVTSGVISAISQANPAQVTDAGHGLATGDYVTLAVTGMTELNGQKKQITVVDADNFTLDDTDSTGYGAFVSGTWTLSWADTEMMDRLYVTTFARVMGGITEESGPSPFSPIQTLGPTQPANLSGLDQPPAGNHNITHIRIYKSVSGTLHRIGQVAVGVDTFADTTSATGAAALPVMTTEDYLPIPDDARNLIMLSNGAAACISGKSVCVSEPYQLHAWPLENRYAQVEEPTAIAAFGSSIVVLLPSEKPQLLSGSYPSDMGQDYFELEQTCESARSVTTIGGMVIFAAPDGLCGVGPGVATNLTEGILDRDNWRDLKPSSILGVAHDNRYYGFYDDGTDKGCFVFDPKNQLAPWQTLDVHATAAWSDKATDSLYLVVDGEIVQFDAGTGTLKYTWQCRDYILPKPLNMAVAKVEAADYLDITLEVIADDRVVHRQRVRDEEPFWLPDGYRSKRYGLRLTGSSEIQSVMLAESMQEIEAQ